MKKIVFTAMMLFAIAGITQAQTPKKEAVKPASSVSTVANTPKKPTSNTKTNTNASTQKVNATNIGKHKKRAHHKAAKKPAKKS